MSRTFFEIIKSGLLLIKHKIEIFIPSERPIINRKIEYHHKKINIIIL